MTREALGSISSNVKRMVAKIESRLRTVNHLGESWPVDTLEKWAPDVGGGEQLGPVSSLEGVDVGGIQTVAMG